MTWNSSFPVKPCAICVHSFSPTRRQNRLTFHFRSDPTQWSRSKPGSRIRCRCVCLPRHSRRCIARRAFRFRKVGSLGDEFPWRALRCSHAPHSTFSVERHQRPPSGAVAQSISALAHRDLLRCQDDANRISGILGVSVARAHQSVALSKMDCRDGPLCPSQGEKSVRSVLSIQENLKS